MRFDSAFGECLMNILLVTQGYHPIVGGVEVHVRQVAHALTAASHHVEIAAMNFLPPRSRGRTAILNTDLLAQSYASIADGPVPVHSLTPSAADRTRMLPIAIRLVPLLRRFADRAAFRFGYAFYRAVYRPRLKHLMRAMKADVVHSLAGGYLGWSAQEAAAELGIPLVCTPFVHPQQWGDSADDVAYYRRADAVIGLVPTDAEYLASIGTPREKLHVIGVSPELSRTTDPQGFRRRHGLENVPLILYVGRMMRTKGSTAVIAAAPRVWQTHPNSHFVFIGPASPQEAAAFNTTDPRIRYLGKVSLQEKADALAACDLFCMPSLSEILPTVYLEAWSYGKPVVGGLAPGLRELVKGNGAGVSASQDPQHVATAIETLLDNEELRTQMGQRGRELVKANYSVDAVTGALIALYQHLATRDAMISDGNEAPHASPREFATIPTV
jgi:glycosyltransferase involved in cell wall biosynthesis